MIVEIFRRKKLILVLGLIAVIILGVSYGITLYMRAPRVETTIVQEGKITDYLNETGVVEARYSSRILSQVSGQIENVAVSVGDKVEQGQVLLEVASAQIDLQIKALQAQLQRVQAAYDDIVNPVSENTQSIQLQIDSLASQVKLAKDQYHKSKQLYEEGIISADALQNAESAYTVAANELKIVENKLQLIERGGSENVREQYLAQIDEIKYNIERLRSTQGNYQVRAPIQGTITALNGNPGDSVIVGMEIVKIANLTELYVSAEILASEVLSMHEGARARILDNDGKVMSELIVNKIYPTAHLKISDLGIQQKRVRVELGLPEENNDLRVGFEVDIEIITREKDNALFVNEEAVYTIGNQDYVLVLDGRRVKEIAIETGWKTDDVVEVLSGLSLGEKIIVLPPENLKDGGFVRVNR